MSSNTSNLIASQRPRRWIRNVSFAFVFAAGLCPYTQAHGQLIELAEQLNAGADADIATAKSPVAKDATSILLPQAEASKLPEGSIAAALELNIPTSPASGTEAVHVPLPLGAREVGCQAAQRWKPAIGLKQRALTIQRLYCEQDECKRIAANGIAQFLCLQANHQEDLAAATAMRAYYSRIGIHEQRLLIANGKQAVGTQQTKQNKLMEKGLAAGVDLSSLDRQNFDLDDQRLQADSQDDQLRRLLAGMAGIDYAIEQKILEPLVVEPQSVDCDALVARALRDRYDLQSWRTLHRQINEESAPMFASIIATSVGSFGIPVPKMTGLKQLLCSSYDKGLLAENLRQEVAVIIATNESYAQQLVFEKCSQLKLAYQRHQLQLQRIQSWEYRLKQIESLESHGDTRPAERAVAETGLLKARSDESARRLDAKLAEVSLAEVVGGLSNRCCRGEAWLPTP